MMRMLSPEVGYALWAPDYERETAISALDEMLVSRLTPRRIGNRLLDAGCGTGRRLRQSGASMAVGVELSPEMLRAGAGEGGWPDSVRVMQGDVRALPLPDAAFDLVWCRLVIGHLHDCRPAFAELVRVADRGASVIVTDFHPRAVEAGHSRSFRHQGELIALEHHVHDLYTQREAAAAVGLELIKVREGRIGPPVRDFYAQAGKLDLYERSLGLPVVLALEFRKPG